MYIYFDKNGTLKEIVADIPARRGSNDYNKIYVYLEGKTPNDISDIWYKQQFPDGTQSIEVSIKDNTVTKAIPYDKNVDMKFFQDYVEYPFYYINLNSSYLAQNGLNLGTIRVVIGDEIFALGMITFNVETNVVVKDTDISQSQYDYLLTRFNELDDKVDKQSSSGDWNATIHNEDGEIYLESEENGEKSRLTLEGSIGSLQSQVDVDHRGYISFAGGNASLYSLVGDYENEIIMNETEFYLQRKDKEDDLVIHKIDLVNGTIDGRAFDYSDVKRYQITTYTSGSTDYNFTQSGIDTNNLVAFRLVFNTVDANKNLKINNKNVRLSTNPTSNATMGMLKSFKEDGANVYDFYAFYNGTYFYVINQNMYDKDVTMTHITLGSLTGTLSTSIQQSISNNGIETLFNITAFSGLLPILFRPYLISSGVYNYRSVTPLNDADGSYYYEGSINLNDGTYDLSTKTYITSGGGIAQTMIETTYADLVSAISNDELVAGCWYRITDYVTKVKGVYDLTAMLEQTAYLPYAKSVEHPFDLLVLATSENTLNENAKAMLHEGDTYFASQNLGAWEIKYTVENDDTKYSWVDSTNGKGTIYYMKDEYNNSCYYDFKNIQVLCFGAKTGNSYGFDFDTNIGGYSRYNSLFEVFSELANIGYAFNFSAKDLSGTSMIKTIVLLSRTDDTYLSQLYDWDTLCAVLSSMAGETIDINTLSYLWGISVADLQAMTNLDFIHTILEGDFYYTFDSIDTTDSIFTHYDLSLVGGNCHDNEIGHSADILSYYLATQGQQITIIPNGISCNVFQTDENIISTMCNKIGDFSFLNIFGTNAYIGTSVIGDNRLENLCFSNKISASENNILKNGNSMCVIREIYNSLDLSNVNVWAIGSYNSIGTNNSDFSLLNASSTIIGNKNTNISLSNVAGVTMGSNNKNCVIDSVTDTNIGNACNSLEIVNMTCCSIGNNVSNILSYTSGNSDTCLKDCNYCTFENGVADIIINVTDNSSGKLMVKINAGITSKTINATRGLTYLTTYKDTNSTDVNV